jgi:3-dehydroquinate synthase
LVLNRAVDTMRSTMPLLTVQIPAGAAVTYPVRIESGLLDQCGDVLRGIFTASRACLVSDQHVEGAGWTQRVAESLRIAGFDVIQHLLQPGENQKTLAAVSALFDAILPVGIDRTTPLIALGGGVVGDIAGFAAATLLRGVPLVQMPTTLLSMVDASVGGKTGVDHPTGKNLIGAFHHPSAVLIDPQTLTTLPPAQMRAGLAECIKHDIIRDAAHFDSWPKILPSILSLQPSALGELVAHNVRIKASVVSADPFERGERAHLNFGHTFAHTFEHASHFAIPHGDAVAIGMIAACALARELGLFSADDARRVTDTIALTGLPTRLPLPLDEQLMLSAMSRDKKALAGRMRFVLPRRIGKVVVRDDAPLSAVKTALALVKG